MDSDSAKPENENVDTDDYLQRVDYGYAFHISGALYQIKSDYPENERDKRQHQQIQQAPLIVKVHTETDWFGHLMTLVAAFISFITIILLFQTVCWTRQQWGTMNATLAQVRQQTGFAQTTAREAQTANEESKDRFRQDERPWVGVTYPETTPMKPGQQMVNGQLGVDLSIPSIVNTGRTPAQNVVLVLGQMQTRDTPFNVFTENDTWMRKMIDNKIAGKFPPGVYTIQSLPPSVYSTQAINDPRYFPKGIKGISALEVPQRRDIGVLLPLVPVKIPIAYMYDGPDANALGALVVYGKVTYREIHGTIHSTTFCSYSLYPSKTPFIACPVFNNVP